MKKILLVNNTLGGIISFRKNLIEELESNGYKVAVIADSEGKEKPKNMRFIDLRLNRRGVNPFEDMKLILNYLKLYRQEKPDIILHYTIKPNIYGTLAAQVLRIPCINTVNGCGSAFLKTNFVGKIVRKLYRLSFKFPRKVLFQNPDDMQEFLQRDIVSKKQSKRVYGSGVDIGRFYPMEREKNREYTVFLFIGRLIKEKGIEIFCKVAEEFQKRENKVKFQILGEINLSEKDSISQEYLFKLVNRGTVEYLGVSTDVREEIRNCDCLLFPSYYREGVPRSLLEGGAMGKALLTTNSPGCKETVENGFNGYLIEPKDLRDTVRKVEDYLRLSKEEKEKMGKNSRKKIIREFDEKEVFKTYMSSIEKIFKGEEEYE